MVEVVHRPDKQRYEVQLDDETAYMAYRPRGEKLEFYSTQVPPAFRGRGIAGAIVKKALDDALAAGRQVIPTCGYVDSYVKRHSQYDAIVVPPDGGPVCFIGDAPD